MKKNHRKLYGYMTTNRAKHNLKIHLILVCKSNIERNYDSVHLSSQF